jgi:hypothetical protein
MQAFGANLLVLFKSLTESNLGDDIMLSATEVKLTLNSLVVLDADDMLLDMPELVDDVMIPLCWCCCCWRCCCLMISSEEHDESANEESSCCLSDSEDSLVIGDVR